MSTSLVRRIAGIIAGSAAALAIAGFTALGSLFHYPQILAAPVDDILAAFRAEQGAIVAWFVALAVGAALMAPLGLLLGRIASGSIGRWIAGIGIASAVVQVIGLSRWALFIPAISSDALEPGRAQDTRATFTALHFWLGTIVGETIGYALTATFTVLVVVGVVRRMAPWWMSIAGLLAAALIATGVLIPVGVSAATLTNFIGYIVWCAWLIALSVFLILPAREPRVTASEAATRSEPAMSAGRAAAGRERA